MNEEEKNIGPASGTGKPRAAVVVGSAGGIGAECVRMLAAAGWQVFALDLRGAADLPPGVAQIPCDIADAAAVRAAFAAVARQCDGLHALLCCAGVLRTGALDAMPTEDFDAIYAVNVRGPYLCLKAAVPMLEAGSSPSYRSRVVMLSSTAGSRPPKLNGGAYASTKAALNVLTQAFAGELATRGILVNAVAPGAVDTPFTRNAAAASGAKGYKAGSNASSPLGRMASAADVVKVMKFLLGDDATHLIGSVVTVDGGASAVRV